MSHPLNRKIVEMAGALRTAKQLLAGIRQSEFESYTIPPDRSFDHMDDNEKRTIRRYDRALKKIEQALS